MARPVPRMESVEGVMAGFEEPGLEPMGQNGSSSLPRTSLTEDRASFSEMPRVSFHSDGPSEGHSALSARIQIRRTLRTPEQARSTPTANLVEILW